MSTYSEKYFNRELSWLEFNQRVLDEAADESIPLLERLKFLAITCSNMDEFFGVRIGGLQTLEKQKSSRTDPAGLTAAQQLREISHRAHQMATDQHSCFQKDLEPALEKSGIRRLSRNELSNRQYKAAKRIFESEVFTVLTPMVLDSASEFPLLINQTLNILVRFSPESNAESEQSGYRYALIPFGPYSNRFITLPSDGGYEYLLIEDIVQLFIARFFPNDTVIECVPFRMTRNADMSVREDEALDLLETMEEVLDARKQSDCVRLELSDDASSSATQFLHQALSISDEETYANNGPLDLASFMRLTDLNGYDHLKYEAWPPKPSPDVDLSYSMFENLSQREILLCHPFESFDPVVKLVEEAAGDPSVLAIKQILYRTSRNSPIIAALVRAAQQGKHVTVIVELKARFDEARNIEWARNLEQAGVQVIYGLKGLKTHAKICIIIRREPSGIQRYIHFGTGNYNEVTSRLYTDISYMTADYGFGADASRFFNMITGYSQPGDFQKIHAAPLSLREKVLEMINSEIELKKQGQEAHIIAKLNALVDPRIIEALYAASQSGVKIELIVRGVCCLRPGIEGLSENIRVVSIIDRYLEHSRIIYFRHGGDNRVFISSADWMPRNLDRRVELLVPIENPSLANRLIDILKICLNDTAKGRKLLPNGQYEKIQPDSKAEPVRSQQVTFSRISNFDRSSERIMFEPYRATSGKNDTKAVQPHIQPAVGMKKTKKRTLLILRHAKSSWKNADRLDDFDRPLNARGKRDAERMGEFLAGQGIMPDHIIASSAKRARKTTEKVAKSCRCDEKIQYEDSYYLASPAEYLEVLRQVGDEWKTVMIVGHNPGLEELLEKLTGHDERLTTATLAQVELTIDHWRELDSATPGVLVNLWRPADVS